jgi:hypothetical protein
MWTRNQRNNTVPGNLWLTLCFFLFLCIPYNSAVVYALTVLNFRRIIAADDHCF